MGLLPSECHNCKTEINLIAGEPKTCHKCGVKLDAEYLWRRHHEIFKEYYDRLENQYKNTLEKRKNK